MVLVLPWQRANVPFKLPLFLRTEGNILHGGYSTYVDTWKIRLIFQNDSLFQKSVGTEVIHILSLASYDNATFMRELIYIKH